MSGRFQWLIIKLLRTAHRLGPRWVASEQNKAGYIEHPPCFAPVGPRAWGPGRLLLFVALGLPCRPGCRGQAGAGLPGLAPRSREPRLLQRADGHGRAAPAGAPAGRPAGGHRDIVATSRERRGLLPVSEAAHRLIMVVAPSRDIAVRFGARRIDPRVARATEWRRTSTSTASRNRTD